jgi:hypothetical protein
MSHTSKQMQTLFNSSMSLSREYTPGAPSIYFSAPVVASSVHYKSPGNGPPFGSAPSTPNLRNRTTNFTEVSPGSQARFVCSESISKKVSASPTSTTMSDSGVSFHATDNSSQTADLRVHPSAGFLSNPRKITIRSDPTLLTCFDPADKQLHDLWVPRS